MTNSNLSNLFKQVAYNQQSIDSLIGTFLNRIGYSDVDPIGQVIGVKGKKTLIVREVLATEQKTKLEWVAGGFSAICLNQGNQSWDFEITDNIIEIKVTKAATRQIRSNERPVKYYDYNF